MFKYEEEIRLHCFFCEEEVNSYISCIINRYGRKRVMTGKVFLSCGQRPGREKKLAERICKLLQQKFGLDSYLAIKIQSLNDIMKITEELKSSDYFLFIDFFRKDDKYFPVSLFTHQELALAHNLGFRDIIAFQEKGAPLEGFLKYVQSNPEPFQGDGQLLEKVERFVMERKWIKNYSRNLVLEKIHKVGPMRYNDQTGSHFEYIWHANIVNRRPDIAAVNSVCILDSIELSDGTTIACYDRSNLKWANQMGYQRTILPEDFGIIDIFAIHADEPGIFLHSARDLVPRESIVKDGGRYRLHYKVFSEGFPLLTFCVEIDYQPSSPTQIKWENSTEAKLVK